MFGHTRRMVSCNVDMATAAVCSLAAVATAYVWWKASVSARLRNIRPVIIRSQKEGDGDDSGVVEPGNHQQQLQLPSPCPVLPSWLGFIGGHTLLMKGEKIVQQWEGWAMEFAGDYEMNLFGVRMVVVTGFEEIRRILSLRPFHFRRGLSSGSMLWAAGEVGVVPSLFFDEGKAWGRSRRLISPCLGGAQNIAAMLPVAAQIGERLCAKLSEQADSGEVVHAKASLNQFTHDIIALGLFGMDSDSIRATKDRPCPAFEAMNSATTNAGDLMMKPLKLLGWLTIPSMLPWARRTMEHSRRLRDVVQGLIDGVRADGLPEGESPGLRGNLLRKIVGASKGGLGDPAPGGKGVSVSISDRMKLEDDEILPQLKSLFIGGTETAALSIGWALYFLTKFPEKRARCRREALEVAPQSAGMASTNDQLSRLVFCSAVLKETNRIRSPAPHLFFHNTKDYTTKAGLHFESGTSFCLLTRFASMSEDNFTKSTEFIPERWIDAERDEALFEAGGASDQIPRHVVEAFLTFGSGPRVCPGQQLATAEAVILLAAICARFDFSLAPGQADPPEEIAGFISAPRNLDLIFKRKCEG